MSVLSKTTDAVSLMVEGLDAIEAVVKNTPLEKADEAMHAVLAILQALQNGISGQVSPDTVRADLAKLTQSIATNDTAADAELASRFPKG